MVAGDLPEWSAGGLGGGVHEVAVGGQVAVQTLDCGGLSRSAWAVDGDEDSPVPARHDGHAVWVRAYCSRASATSWVRT